MYLGLIVTSRCNAACTHCSTSCGPQRTEALPRDRILTLMDEAAASSKASGDDWMHFSISGGEPFLDFPLLIEAIAHGHRLGAETSCVSNAYWASSDAKAQGLLEQLKVAGLDLLAVSTSRFHQQFVKRSRVERALRIARDIGLDTQLKFVRTRSDEEDEATITAWAESCGRKRGPVHSADTNAARGWQRAG
jgi:MoaA/NifB/PqqE/SkfB family radical SAM enzyme